MYVLGTSMWIGTVFSFFGEDLEGLKDDDDREVDHLLGEFERDLDFELDFERDLLDSLSDLEERGIGIVGVIDDKRLILMEGFC